eukprot:s2874_g3.t1
MLVEGGPNGGLLLLKQSAERCSERPVILVLDALRRERFHYATVNKHVPNISRALGQPNVQKVDDLFKMQSSHDADRNAAKEIKEKVIDHMTEKAWKKIVDDEEERAKKTKKKDEDATEKPPEGVKSDELTELKIKEEDGEIITWTKKKQREVEAIKMDSALLTAQLLRHSKPLEKPDLEPLKLKVSDFWDLKEESKGWTLQSSRSVQQGLVKWNQWHFRGGTHYVFTDHGSTELRTDCLAPIGSVFLGGGASSKEALLRMLVNGEPVVCLDNTGRLTQDFVRCHNFLCNSLFNEKGTETLGQLCGHRLGKRSTAMAELFRFKKERSKGTKELLEAELVDPRVDLVEKAKTDFLKRDIARSSVFHRMTNDGVDGTNDRDERSFMVDRLKHHLGQVTSFTQPELCQLLLVYLRRGLQITKLCVVMDPLDPRECAGGHTEDKLSICLSNFVILASNDTSDFADVEAVKAATNLKLQLEATAKKESIWALAMTYMLVILNFTSLIVALVRNSDAPYFQSLKLPSELLRWSLPGMSAASTFISGLVGRFRFMLRWSKARSAAAQLEAEIWKFRTRVCDYAVVGAREDEEGGARPEEGGQNYTRERKQDVTRSLFRANVNSIFNSAMEEMGTSSLHGHGVDELPTPRPSQSKIFGFLCWSCRRRDPGQLPKEATQDPISRNRYDAPSQLDWKQYGHLGRCVDEYYQQRTLKVFERMKNQASWLTFKQGSLESLVLLLGTFGVLLSTFDQTDIAMICLSVAASLQSLERFHALSTRLDAANAGERDLICAWQDWSAMEPRATKVKACIDDRRCQRSFDQRSNCWSSSNTGNVNEIELSC